MQHQIVASKALARERFFHHTIDVSFHVRQIFFSVIKKGQQIWCDSKADGDSPDDREDDIRMHKIDRILLALSR